MRSRADTRIFPSLRFLLDFAIHFKIKGSILRSLKRGTEVGIVLAGTTTIAQNMTTDIVSPATEWTKPSTRPAHIEQLISGVDRYNPQNLTTLSDYLSHQLETGEYDCLANLAILKL
jgi:hypothetical protein